MFGISGALTCECGPNADRFVHEWFSDCVYTTWELVAFWIGMSSVMFWIVAQLPQFLTNLKNRTADALSPWFLLQWLAGDSFNLLGCLLTGNQLATETFTATYFIFADCVIISQYVYYNTRANEDLSLEEKDQESSSLKREHLVGFTESSKETFAEFTEPSKETFSEFQKRLSKIIVRNPELSEDLEFNDEAQVEGHQHHPVTFVAGRSGVSMITHAVRSPQVPRSPHADHFEKSSQTITTTTTPPSPERGRSEESNFGAKPGAQCQSSAPSTSPVRALQDQADGRAGQFRSTMDRNLSLEERRSLATDIGKIPDVHVQHLFPSANAMKRRLRRLVHQYGLECGPPSASRLTIHHNKSLGKGHVENRMRGTVQETSRLASRLTRRPVKAAACLASLLAVGTSTNFFHNSGVDISGRSQGLAIASRRILNERGFHPEGGLSLGSASSSVAVGRKLRLICGEGQRPWLLKSVGTCLGWGSSGLYFGSRFSQIAMNYQRRSTEGLSLAMLGCAMLANTCMGLSILMRVKSWEDLANKTPWLSGSMGTFSLDIFILLQKMGKVKLIDESHGNGQCLRIGPVLIDCAERDANYLNARRTKSSQAGADEHTALLA